MSSTREPTSSPIRRSGWQIPANDAEPALCPTCKRPVQPDDRSAVSPGEDGRPVLHSIRLLRAESTALAS